jgi:hypothetical protein
MYLLLFFHKRTVQHTDIYVYCSVTCSSQFIPLSLTTPGPNMTTSLPTKFVNQTASNLLSFEGTQKVVICRTYGNHKAITHSFEHLTFPKLNSKLRVLESLRNLETIYPVAQCNMPEEKNFQQHCCGELKSRKSTFSTAEYVYAVNEVIWPTFFVFRNFIVGRTSHSTSFELI